MAAPLIFKNVFLYPVESILQAGFFVMLSVSLALLMGLAGQVSLGHAAFFGIGAYASSILSTMYGLPVLLSIPLATTVGMGMGFLIGYPVLKLKSHYLSLATLGIGIAVQEFFKAAQPITGGETGLYNLPDIKIGNFEFSSPLAHYYVVWTFALIAIFFCDRLSKSFFGKRLIAIHSDEQAAEGVGINVFWAKVYVFTFSSALAAFAGSLFAHCSYGAIEPGGFGVGLSIKIVIMVVIGGMYSVYGATMGAIIVSLLPEIIRRLGGFTSMDLTYLTYIQDIVFAVILIVFIIFTPQGIIGKKANKNA